MRIVSVTVVPVTDPAALDRVLRIAHAAAERKKREGTKAA